ncbi:nicotinate-nucleotide adenylyltransferase [Paraglaciecola arctica]|uniref:nicotinate-nucleotide adenylyltransferase n=1 Tax=Paraglaciecola arctica TaxID=1128911 RepID=UPI001C069F49|nr:nicotinate-nucleotide adenylyltransferase [Paraglaciecola arctica]MBU3002927.1 nicotinate-nucleotide adenylyltransferase [Paraglaciecola arctica]
MKLTPPLGIFGGTFDPIHNGHIFPVIEAAEKTNITKIALMPCYIPSHKDPATASSEDRLKMVKLICGQYPLFYADSRDINRGKPTFSVDSLTEIRQSMPTTPLCFFIGTDSLQNLFTWHNWEKLFSLCHFVVCSRDGETLNAINTYSDALQTLLKKRQVTDPIALHNSLAGYIYLANTQTLTVSSTEIRKQIFNNQSVEKLLPSKILDYIQRHKLYQPHTDFC